MGTPIIVLRTFTYVPQRHLRKNWANHLKYNRRSYGHSQNRIFELGKMGAGDKDSLKSMPSMYFPYGGGLDTILGGAERFIDPDHDPALHLQNGEETHTAILRLARAITITPRQLIKVFVTGVSYEAGGNATLFGARTATGRNMLDPIANLNAVSSRKLGALNTFYPERIAKINAAETDLIFHQLIPFFQRVEVTGTNVCAFQENETDS